MNSRRSHRDLIITYVTANTKLRGIYDMWKALVQEPRNKFKVKGVKVQTDKNVAVGDMITKSLAVPIRRRLFGEIELTATKIAQVACR